MLTVTPRVAPLASLPAVWRFGVSALTGCVHVNTLSDRRVGLVVKASASRASGLGSIPAFNVDLCHGGVMPVTSNLVI